MPIGSITAVPFNPTDERLDVQQSHRLIHPNSLNVPLEIIQEESEAPNLVEDAAPAPSDDTLLSKGRIINIKCFQLISTIIVVAMFMYEKSTAIACDGVDLLIAGFYGALIMYPLIVINLPKFDNFAAMLLILNLISSLMMFANGYFIFFSWYVIKNEMMSSSPASNDPIITVATFKSLTATSSFIIGSFYAVEVFILILDNIRKLF